MLASNTVDPHFRRYTADYADVLRHFNHLVASHHAGFRKPHPGFFAYFSITGSGPGVLAEMLSAGLNVQAMLWRTSPVATELEQVALAWLRQLMRLPDAFEGVIYDTASVSVLHALAAAREAVRKSVTLGSASKRCDLPA